MVIQNPLHGLKWRYRGTPHFRKALNILQHPSDSSQESAQEAPLFPGALRGPLRRRAAAPHGLGRQDAEAQRAARAALRGVLPGAFQLATGCVAWWILGARGVLETVGNCRKLLEIVGNCWKLYRKLNQVLAESPLE